ncbi:MAG: OmpH family outer membrane protein [Bacillota bacterium]
MTKNSLVIGLLMAVLVFSGAFIFSAEAGAADVGYVNMQEIYEAHPVAQEINMEMQEEIGSLQESYEEDMDDSEEDEEAQSQMQQEFQQEATEIQEEYMQKLEDEIEPDLDDARKELGLDLIVDNEVVVSGGEDVTEEVLEHFEDLE